MRGRAIGVLLAACLGAGRLGAQDTVVVIDPDAPPIQLRSLQGPPPEVVEEAVARYNDTTVTSVYGSFTIASGTGFRGELAVYRGTLRVSGRIDGRVTVINGNLIISGLGRVEGDILLVGGRVEIAAGGIHHGALRTWAEPAQVYRTAGGTLVEREAPPTLGELAAARTSFEAGRLKTTLSLETGRTYNRIEGLPILAGPTFSFPTPDRGEARLLVWGLLRTEKDNTGQLSQFGWRVRAGWESKSRIRGGIAFRWESEVQPIENRQLSRSEIGWASFLFRRDYDDYYEREGLGGEVFVYPVPSLRLAAGARFDRERTVPASDPVTLFRSGSAWRPNPLIDDGRYTTIRAEATLDTRNSPTVPTRGWYLHGWYEHGTSDDVAPVTLPSEIRGPIPTSGSYGFDRIGFDARVHQRINQAMRANLRLVGEGWLAGDPLPIQHRVSIGGPGLLPGLPFRAQNCSPSSFTDPTGAALCDRSLTAQAELRYRFPLRFRELLGADEWILLDRLFGSDRADVVLFGDAGKAWLVGDGPGRVPANRIPVAKEWEYDLGAGLDLGGFGVFVAQALSRDWSPRITFRLGRRF